MLGDRKTDSIPGDNVGMLALLRHHHPSMTHYTPPRSSWAPASKGVVALGRLGSGRRSVTDTDVVAC